MLKPASITGAAAGAAGIAFVVLYPILGVTLWVALLAAGCLLALGALGAPALDARVRLNPIVDVRVLRTRYALTLGMALLAGFLVVETWAFAPSTAVDVGFALGIAATAAGVAGMAMARVYRMPAWGATVAAVAAIGAWQVVQALVFGTGTARWLTFADACGLLGAALAGLAVHELSTERVVHSLEVVEATETRPSTRVEREAAHA